MLYQLYEAQRALLSPFAEFASASSKLYRHPLSPFTHTPMAHRVSAGLDLMHRLSKEYEKPEFNITSVSVAGIDVAVQEQVATARPFCRLLRFKRLTDNLAMNKSHEWFEHNVIYRVPVNYPGAGRRVYPGFLQHTGFVAMNPDRHLSSHYDYFLDLVRGDDDSADSHREFYDEYNAVLDMPAEYYLDTIRVVFQEFALVNGTWEVNGKLVRPEDISTSALLTIEGELDDISGAGQTKAAH